MKMIITAAGNVGPFEFVDDIGDAYVGDGAVLPKNILGAVEIIDWTPPPPAPVVPRAVTRRQARQALLLNGLLDQVQPAIDAIPDATQRALAQIEWDDSLEFQRDRPLVISIAAQLGLTPEGLDDLFIQASSL